MCDTCGCGLPEEKDVATEVADKDEEKTMPAGKGVKEGSEQEEHGREEEENKKEEEEKPAE